jgi:hypothetical protein
LLNGTQWDDLSNTVADGAKLAIHYWRESGSIYGGPPNYVILKEKIASEYFGFGMAVNSFIFKAYGDKIAQLHESGIIEWIFRKYKPKNPPIDDNRVALSLDHLMIWFKLWIGLLLIVSVVFSVELLIGKFQKVLKKKRRRITRKGAVRKRRPIGGLEREKNGKFKTKPSPSASAEAPH